MAMLQVRQVNRQGQISIGKKYSGRKVEISEYPDGTVVLRPVEIISEFELRQLKDRTFQERLSGSSRWEQQNAPAETDLDALEDGLET
ncbi:MAG: hypothetical protein D3916_15185 [Candidatus Electrothrix sp. MAN1_4]|nr:hypothetical protein [Candidatus Electrothrix sp. MAN1_4]